MNLNDNSPFNFEPLEADASFKSNEDSEFNFDQSQSNDITELNEEIADLTESVRLMTCVCPICAEKTEVDLTLMPDNEFVIICSSCNKQINIMRESCACRAKRKSNEINCANCGKLLDQQVHCHSCGTNFPDYFVTFDPKDARRKARNKLFSQKWAAIRDFNFSFSPAFKSGSQAISTGYSPQRINFNSTASSKLLSRKNNVLVISLFVAVFLIAAGIFAYNSYKTGQIYAENYIKSLYCIKTGIDLNIRTCTSLKTDWESALTAGRNFSPGIGGKEDTKSAKLRSEVEKYMQKMIEPPKRFSKANESIKNIYAIYLDTDVLVQSKPRSPQELGNSVDNLNKKMALASQALKSNLPDSLKQELENAKLKYRGMKDF